jgi:hypothetical protein
VFTFADCGVPPVAEILGPVAAAAMTAGVRTTTQAANPPLRVIDVSLMSYLLASKSWSPRWRVAQGHGRRVWPPVRARRI